MKCFTICYSLLINVCYPVTRGKAQSDYTAPHTAQIVTSSKKHSASFGDELNQSKVMLDIKPSSFLSCSTRETMSSPPQHSSVLPRQHLSFTAELIGAGGRIKRHAASPPLGCTGAGVEDGLQALLPAFPHACSSLGLSGAIGVGLRLPPSTKQSAGISKSEMKSNSGPLTRIQVGMIKTECVLGWTKTEHRNQVFVFPSSASALFSIKEYLGDTYLPVLFSSANLTLRVSLYHERIQKSGFTASCVMYYTPDQLHHYKNKCKVEVSLQPSN